MQYRVTTLHATRPTDLPPGATVEEVPATPLQLNTKEGDTVTVAASAIAGNTAYIHAINRKSGRNAVVSLDEAETRKVHEALSELLGIPDPGPIAVRDRGGDVWVRQSDGTFTIDWGYDDADFGDLSESFSYSGKTLTYITDIHGPVRTVK